MRYVLLLLTIVFLSCNNSDINIKREIPLKANTSPVEFNEISLDENHFIFLEVIEDVDILALKSILNLSVNKFEKKLNIPDYNLIIDGRYQKVIMIREFDDYGSAESFHEKMPDLSSYIFDSYPVSFSNYRLILSSTNGLLKYREFLLRQ